MRAMVVPLADRFSTTHHGKTVDATMLYFLCFFFLLSISLTHSLLNETTNDENGNKGTSDRGGPDFTIFN